MKSSVLRFSTLTFGLALTVQLPAAHAAGPASDSETRQTKTISAGSSKQAAAINPQQQIASAGQQLFSQAELDQMLAPVALYPDTVLSHVLIAATYPLEIVKATRWLSAQPGMTSEQALKAAENEPWDPSVRALVAFPPLLTKMNNELEWTQKLGDAFLIQQQQVMATVQTLREKAYATGHLKDQEHITVQRQEKVIIIEPRQREVIYVPVYDTRVVYGDWWWRDYPPIHWPYPGYGNHVSLMYWGAGSRVSTSFYFSTFYWPRREIVVINHHHRPKHYYRYDDIIRHEERRHWRHNPQHRHGVVYHSSYQPNREYSGADYRQSDIGERRRWAAEQRQQQNVVLPGDQQIQEQYPVVESSGRDIFQTPERPARNAGQQQPRIDVGNTPPVIESIPDTVVTERGGERPMPRENPKPREVMDEEAEPLPRHASDGSVMADWRKNRQLPAPKVLQNEDPAPRPEPMPESMNQQTVIEQLRAAPVQQKPEPVYRQAEPVYQQAEPVFQQAEPVYRQAEPVYQQAEPVYRQNEPVYQQAEPVYRQTEPVYQQPEPVQRQPDPVFQQPVEQQTERPIESHRQIE